ncbi:hypothetical protein [Streptomyces sp. H27-D2]|uniref:hypothetical protein n=1 Tax=Streptomyces sp. H27-D2 TaxID=3046304 RepID=UPI002DB93CEC|nr:hypothetical protein [Streptomyces sp. H27-D2]MEC4021007.1 hypothetical protein [Streptomyces sp. H27-D2]
MSDMDALQVGTLALDVSTDRVGRVMGHVGPYVQLRPPGGGREWDALPEQVHPADEWAELRARISEINANSRSIL